MIKVISAAMSTPTYNCYIIGLHASVSYGGVFINKIKKAILGFFVLCWKSIHFYISNVYIFQNQRMH